MALVADVHTDGNSSSVLEEAIGHPAWIYVVAPTDDGLALCTGGVYSYYEFSWPMSDRLTDGAWQQMLENGTNPPQPEWVSSFVAEGVSEGHAPTTNILSVAPSDLIVADGDELSVSVSAYAHDELDNCTAYIAALDPAGRLLFYPDFSQVPQPLPLSLAAGTLIKDVTVFRFGVVPWVEKGYYILMTAVFDDTSTLIESSVSSAPLMLR